MPTFPNDEDPLSFLGRLLGGGGQQSNAAQDIRSRLSERAGAVVRSASGKAVALNHPTMESIHLLSVLLEEESVAQLIDRTGADRKDITAEVEAYLATLVSAQDVNSAELGRSAQVTLQVAGQFARMTGSPVITPDHIFGALVMNPQGKVGYILYQAGVNPETLQTAVLSSEGNSAGKVKSHTPTLDQFGTDLTEMARLGKLDPVIGRAEEVEQTIEILVRRTKNNPVLIGEPGVGKTAIVEGLAQAIVTEQVPETLLGRRVVSLDLPGMVAGTKFRGDFEERITTIVKEIVDHKDEVIVFLDELHTVLGAGGGGEGGMDAANILKPRLARGDLHMIGATTLKEYRRIEKDAALERRFQTVIVDEPSAEEAILILQGLREAYQEHHSVEYTDEALVAAVNLSSRYVSDHFLPDKAIDLMDQAGAKKRLAAGIRVDTAALQQELADLEREKNRAVNAEHYEEAANLKQQLEDVQARIDRAMKNDSSRIPVITDMDIAAVIASRTGIPVTQLTEGDRVRLAKLEGELHQRVIGQNEAVTAVAKSVRRNRSGMGDPKRPVGSFLFLGGTGVGKTELGRAIAASLFGSEDAMIRVDMSEFGEKHTASRLIGAPPGYVGYDEAGQLTERVRRNPYSVVLLDEIEKAHPDIFNLLLQVLDDGRLTDGQGRTVDFRNTVVIMTSNIGGEFLASRSGTLGFTAGNSDGLNNEETRRKVMGKLRESMRPEFLNRIDEVVLFQKLTVAEVEQIARLILLDSAARLATQGISLKVEDEAVRWLAEHGYEPEYGARPLRRLIQRQIDDVVSDLLISETAREGDTIRFTVLGKDLLATVQQPEPEVVLTPEAVTA